MMPDNENSVDPTVKTLVEMFPEDFLSPIRGLKRKYEEKAKIWPATRTKKVAAGVKVSCVVSAVADGPKSVRIYPERNSEAKILRLGPWLRDRILLIDLGYFKYLFFDRIARYGGYFASRLKGNANPLIVGVNRKWRGNSVDVVGKKYSRS